MASISKVKIKRANGKIDTKYRIAYRNIFGQQTTTGLYDTKEAAKKDLYKYEKVDPKAMNITIGQMCNAYMESVRATHSPTTILDTEAYMNNHLCKLFDIKYEKISSIDLEQFIHTIAKEHTPNVANQALKKSRLLPVIA